MTIVHFSHADARALMLRQRFPSANYAELARHATPGEGIDIEIDLPHDHWAWSQATAPEFTVMQEPSARWGVFHGKQLVASFVRHEDAENYAAGRSRP